MLAITQWKQGQSAESMVNEPRDPDPSRDERPDLTRRIPLWLLLMIEASAAVGMWFAAPVIVRHVVMPTALKPSVSTVPFNYHDPPALALWGGDPPVAEIQADRTLGAISGTWQVDCLLAGGLLQDGNVIRIQGPLEPTDVTTPWSHTSRGIVFSGAYLRILLLVWTALNLLVIHLRWWRRKRLVTLVGAAASLGAVVASVATLVIVV